MESLGPGSHRTSPASSTRSLDLRRLSTRADSAYSSFSTASGGPEPRTLSPGTDFPYLDWDYVRVVWGGPASTAGLRTSPQPQSAAAAHSAPRPPQVQGTPGTLSKQATPLLYALAAEVEAAARAEEPPSPPASRAAYRQRLQGAQRRVLRETSFQRKELRMSLPACLRPTAAAAAAAAARPPTAHARSASLSHPGGEVESARSRAPTPGTVGRGSLASQQWKWCFSEPGKLDRVGWGGGLARACAGEPCFSLSRPEPQELQHPALAGFGGYQVRRLPETQPPGTEDPEPGALKFGCACRPVSQSRSTTGEVLGPWGDPGEGVPTAQAIPQEAETSRSLFQSRLYRSLIQKEVTVMCTAVSTLDCEKKLLETCTASARLPSLPDDEVFLEEAPLVRVKSPADSHAPLRLLISVHDSEQQYGAGLDQRADPATVPPEDPLHEHLATAGTHDCWQGLNGSVDASRSTCCSLPGTVNGDIPTTDPTRLLPADSPAAAENEPLQPPLPADVLGPPGNDTSGPPDYNALPCNTGQTVSRPTWPSPRLEELVQELARLDPSLSDTLTACPSPEPSLDLLEGLIPVAEVWAAMRPACGEAREDAAGTSEPGSYLFSSTQLLPTSQEETRPEHLIPNPVPEESCGQVLPEPNNSIQAKKVELANLLQQKLRDLLAQQEQLQRMAQAWARRRAVLEAAVGQSCAPRELERFSRFLADLERVLGLLLLLGSRLARVRRALARAGEDSDPDERASLLQRLGLLQRQQEDARELKEHVARRERALREVLARALSAEELRAYCALLAGKAAVLAQQRSLDERVRLLQDQLDALRSDFSQPSPPPRPAWPPGPRPREKPPFPPPLT